MTLQETKEQYAKENGYSSWEKLELYSVHREIVDAVNEISKRHAKAKLEEAADRMEKEYKGLYRSDYWNPEVNSYKKSITETPLD